VRIQRSEWHAVAVAAAALFACNNDGDECKSAAACATPLADTDAAGTPWVSYSEELDQVVY
jgi:hypothetical protein